MTPAPAASASPDPGAPAVAAGPSDRELMAKVRDGELELLAELFERHQRRLFNFFLRLAPGRSAAEDLVQEVFVRMLKYRHTFKSEAEFTPWMFALANAQSTSSAPAELEFRRSRRRSGGAARASGRRWRRRNAQATRRRSSGCR
jgi:RNA polymerase sigma factor (sigma-70 family)